MKEHTRMRFAIYLIVQNIKRVLCGVLIVTVCLLTFAYAVLLHYANRYNYITSDEVFLKGVKNTGTLLVEGDLNTNTMNEMIAEIRALDGVHALGMSSNNTGFNADIFAAYADDETVRNAIEDGTIDGFLASLETAEICQLQLLEGTLPAELEQDATTMYLYLGYDFRNIPLGTLYERELPDGTMYRVVVAGIMEKGQRWMDAVGYAFFDCNSLSDYVTMDSCFLFCQSEITSFPVFFNIEGGYEFTDVKQEILAIGERYGQRLAIGSIEEKYVMAQEQRKVMNRTLRECLMLMIVTAASFLICLQVIEFYHNKRQYGLFLITGMTIKDISHIIVWKKILETIVAICMAYGGAFKLCQMMFGIHSEVDIVIVDVLRRYVIGWLLVIGLVFFFISSFLSIAAVKRYVPIELLERGE